MIRQKASKLLHNYWENKYHSSHKKSALKILKGIEFVKGKTDPKLINLSDEYALDILGWKGYAPWLYVYSAMAQKFKKGWIPDNYYGKIVVPKIKGDYGKIADYKTLTNRLFKSEQFPDILYYTNGLWISTEYQVLSEKEIKAIAFKESEKVVYKVDNSIQGRGIFFFDKNNFNSQMIKKLGNGVLQKYINQHSFFDEMMPKSVATIRVTSVINDEGVVSIRACYLRIGRNSDTHVKSASHIRIPVNFVTGVLDKYGYTTDWIQIENHPDSQFLFENKQIPNFDKCIDTVINLHKMLPFTRTIGWDMVIDDQNNVKVMEWNGTHNDIKFSEATQGPCFSDLGWELLWKEN